LRQSFFEGNLVLLKFDENRQTLPLKSIFYLKLPLIREHPFVSLQMEIKDF
jgi:hypothetical protein